MIQLARFAFILVLFFSVSIAGAATSYNDLTAQMYKGPDSNLEGFNLTKFGIGCEEGGVYHPGGLPYISWEGHIIKEQSNSGKKQAYLAEYTIHFRVKDRRGAILLEEEFEYNLKVPLKEGYVIHDPLTTKCDRDAIRLSKSIDLSFATVEYWVTKIQWNKYRPNYGAGFYNN
jgi:hypothetical protein